MCRQVEDSITEAMKLSGFGEPRSWRCQISLEEMGMHIMHRSETFSSVVRFSWKRVQHEAGLIGLGCCKKLQGFYVKIEEATFPSRCLSRTKMLKGIRMVMQSFSFAVFLCSLRRMQEEAIPIGPKFILKRLQRLLLPLADAAPVLSQVSWKEVLGHTKHMLCTAS